MGDLPPHKTGVEVPQGTSAPAPHLVLIETRVLACFDPYWPVLK